MAAGGFSITVADAKRVIHEVVSALQNNEKKRQFGGTVIPQLTISDVFKGGSIGKGTTVPGDFDVDLVIYTRSLEIDDSTSIKSYRKVMEEFDRYLRSQLTGHYIKKGINDHSLQFRYSNVGVDLLISPYFATQQQYYSFLEQIDKKSIPLFSCSAAKWQVEFVQSYPNIVHEYIKRAKAWRNSTWNDDEDGRPSSYLMEVLVIKAYENGGRLDEPTMITQELIKLVCNKQIAVYWTLNYTADKIWKFNSRQPPFIIDPANPSNNLYRSGITKLLTYAPSGYGGDWSKFRSEIHSLDLHQRYYQT